MLSTKSFWYFSDYIIVLLPYFFQVNLPSNFCLTYVPSTLKQLQNGFQLGTSIFLEALQLININRPLNNFVMLNIPTRLVVTRANLLSSHCSIPLVNLYLKHTTCQMATVKVFEGTFSYDPNFRLLHSAYGIIVDRTCWQQGQARNLAPGNF